jgi:uncharacterized membrane protein YraQ (UPF0718 family)
MVILLLVATFCIAFIVASIVVYFFTKPMQSILSRVLPEDVSRAWTRYLQFAIYVVGIGGGVRVWSLEKYMTEQEPYRGIIELTGDRWVLEIYQTIISTLQSAAMLLFAFFVIGLIAVVIMSHWGIAGTGQKQE